MQHALCRRMHFVLFLLVDGRWLLVACVKQLELLGTAPKALPRKEEETPQEEPAENLSDDMTDDEDMGEKKRSKKSKRQLGTKVKKILCKDATLKHKALARMKARERNEMHADDEAEDKKVVAVVRGRRQGIREIHRCRDKKVLRQILKRQRKSCFLLSAQQ
ncbi:hypothetical protein TGMAS_230122 [Toxoplasma gondii MAS]|uniref:Uncharacterized protein n=1 Tax=Toxoplasma gondii MAS TaxID=943118 RepID=A0A086QY77_TOXGO|nr:hypothetical protein TGMAS_230122 [Toxoplasma gondii MAS]